MNGLSYRAGYETAAKRFLPSDLDVDCSAKSFVVTGETTVRSQTIVVQEAGGGDMMYNDVL